MRQRLAQRDAFTLIEMIVVLVILVILVALVVPQVSGYIATAKETAAIHNARAVMSATDLAVLDRQNKGMESPEVFGNGTLDEYLDNSKKKQFYYTVQISNGRITGGEVKTDGISVRLPDLSVSKKG